VGITERPLLARVKRTQRWHRLFSVLDPSETSSLIASEAGWVHLQIASARRPKSGIETRVFAIQGAPFFYIPK